MKINLFLLVCLLLCGGCKDQKNDVEYIYLSPTLVTDDIYINRAVSFFCTNEYIVLQDVISDDGFVKVYNLNGNIEAQLGELGQAPNEFTTPISTRYGTNSIFTRDLNTDRMSIVDLSQIRKKCNSEKFVSYSFLKEGVADVVSDESNNLIVYNPKDESIISIYKPDGTILTSFGSLPFDFYSEIVNKYQAFSGKMYYNNFNDRLVLCLNNIPYSAVYQIKGQNVRLISENVGDFKYHVINGELKLDKPGKDCLVSCVLTRDYIVSIMNDPYYKGRDNSQTSPKRNTIGIFDYDFKLKKIVNIGMVRYNLSAQGEDNIIYVLAQNPEYCIVKVSL